MTSDLDSSEPPLPYGLGDASFRAAGGEAGVQRLVEDFYAIMGEDPRFTPIYQMHPRPIDISVDKLARFLCGWLGGPRRYFEKYGSISIPGVHAHLEIGVDERDQWLGCMSEAIDRQPYEPRFKAYLLQQLSVPAGIIAEMRSRNAGERPRPDPGPHS